MRDAEIVGLRHGLVDESLAQLVVGQDLDLPLRRLRAVHRVGVGRAEHHQRRPPPAVERVLRHRLLLGRAPAQLHHDVEALALVKALFLADADHRARVRAERAAAQRNLVHDRRAVDQPADRADVGPGQRRIVEDARVLGLAGVQVGDQSGRATRRASRPRSRDTGRGPPRPAPWPSGSPCAASVGARVIQLPSGSMPTISECACCEICRISVLR